MTASFLKPADVAGRLDISVRLARDLVASGAIPGIDVSRPGSRRPTYRISEADLIIFEQRRAVRTAKVPKKRRKKDSTIIEFF